MEYSIKELIEIIEIDKKILKNLEKAEESDHDELLIDTMHCLNSKINKTIVLINKVFTNEK